MTAFCTICNSPVQIVDRKALCRSCHVSIYMDYAYPAVTYATDDLDTQMARGRLLRGPASKMESTTIA